MDKLKILIVEDDNDINCLLVDILNRNAYATEQAYSGTEAKLLTEHSEFSLLLLDLMLPGLTGEELIPIIREKCNVPIIVLSAKETPEDRVKALRLGADDYITKPFYEEELLARIEAALRRTTMASVHELKVLEYDDIKMDTEARQVFVAEKQVLLTAREYGILELLMQNPTKVFTKANLYESVWNDEFFGDDNTINVHISNLRNKLERPESIKTVWGIGFKMK